MGKELDNIIEELGKKEKYQIFNYSLISIAVLINATSVFTFIFFTDIPKYR